MVDRGVEAVEDAHFLVKRQNLLDCGAFAMKTVKLERVVMESGRLVNDRLGNEELIVENGNRSNHVVIV